MDTGQAIGLRLARREEKALEDAYAAYAADVLAYVTRYVGPTDAEDVVQRTFLDAWRFAPDYDPGQRFSGWLFTIAKHRAIDVLRGRRLDVVGVEQARYLVGEDGRETADRYAVRAEVRAAVLRLPTHEREVITLTYFGQLSQREVADRLGVPIGTVKARSWRGTRRLGQLIDSGAEDRPVH